jgi:hypothetical protein
LTLKKPPLGFAPGYPGYEVISIDGLTDVVEHRAMEPTFYMTDDAAVREELGVPANNAFEWTVTHKVPSGQRWRAAAQRER